MSVMPTLPSLSLHQSRPLCVRTLRYGFYLQSAYIHSSGSVSFLQQMSCYGLWRMQQKLNPLPKTRHHRDIARNQTRLVSGKRRQRARADGKKRRDLVTNLIDTLFNENDTGETPLNTCAITLDLDDGSLKQPVGFLEHESIPKV
jgi:hypothetical protein